MEWIEWTGAWLVCLFAALWLGTSAFAAASTEVQPKDGAVLGTPLSAVLRWPPIDGADSYMVSVRQEGVSRPVAERRDLRTNEFRLALKPGTRYKWSVKAGDSVLGPFRFTTADTEPHEVTDPRILFAGVHPDSHWQGMDDIVADASASLSPWFAQKKFDDAPPPKLADVRSRLPVPVWDGHKDLLDMYWYAWDTLFEVWLFAPKSSDNMAVSNLIGLPSWGPWGSTMVWDTAFIEQFARYGNAAYPFITGLDNCYARQHENGFICRESDSSNREVYVIYPANPPLLAWAEWRYYEVTGDKGRIEKVFLPLVKQYEWYMVYQRRTSGLYWTNAFQEADDSPRNPLAHSTVSTTAIQCMSANILSRMAKLVGRSDLSAWFAQESQRLDELTNARFWDEKHKVYNDLGADGKPITETVQGGICKHVHMFWPLLAGIAPPERAKAMAEEAVDPDTFNRASGTASLSADSTGYNRENGNYWRGAVWPPTQYMVIKGLERSGQQALASEIADKYVNAALTAFKAQGDITEYLAPDKPEGHGCGKFVGWGGLAPIALFIENILGIQVDAPANTVVWRIRQTERHGIERLTFGKRTVSLLCDARATPAVPCRVTVRSDGEFTLTLIAGGRSTTKAIRAGETEITVGARDLSQNR